MRVCIRNRIRAAAALLLRTWQVLFFVHISNLTAGFETSETAMHAHDGR